MGLQQDYNESGGFSRYLYYQVGETITTSNGVVAKVVVTSTPTRTRTVISLRKALFMCRNLNKIPKGRGSVL